MRPAEAALLIADISGFTALTERLEKRGRDGAEEVARVVTAAFRPVIETIHAAGGSIESFGGDAVFATFESPQRASRALRTAEEIRAMFAARAPSSTSAGPVQLGVSLAVHHGPVAFVHLGSSDRRWYVVTGPVIGELALLATRASGRLVVSPQASARRAAEGAGRARALPGHRSPASYLPALARVRSFEGEYRRVAVLFLETSGSGDVGALQRFYVHLDATLRRYQGTLLKTDLSVEGIKWLCAFGLPRAHEDDADRAASAALDVLGQASGEHRVRGGLHAGIVANVLVGTARRRSVDVMGDTVNTSARVLSMAGWGEVLVTAQTASDLLTIDTTDRGRHEVKGKAKALALRGLVRVRGRHRTATGGSAFVGRDRESQELRRALAAAARGSGSAMGIVGAAGMGKSTLVQSAAREARALGFEVHEGAASALGSSPYHAIVAILLDALQLPDSASTDRLRIGLPSAWARLALSPVDREHLANLLGAPVEDAATARLPPEEARAGTLAAVRNLACRISAQKPRLLVLEDMHWADESTAESACWLAQASATSAYVLLLAYRPGYQPPHGVRELELGGLADTAIAGLVQDRLGTAEPEVHRLVAERAGGNPFFAHELTTHLVEIGAVARRDGSWVLARPLGVGDLPGGVESTIAERLDELPASAREVLRRASVVGMSVPMATLRYLGVGAMADVACLLERGFLLGDDRTLTFRHALTRDVVYGTVLGSQRRRLHRGVARWMEAHVPPSRHGHAALLGHHWEMGGLRARARSRYLQALAHACRLYAHGDAVALGQAYFRVEDRPTAASVEARLLLGNKVLFRLGRADECVDQLRAALALARSLGLRRAQAEAHRYLGDVRWTLGEHEEARRHFGASLALARASRDRGAIAKALGSMANLLSDRGSMGDARARYEEAIRLHRAAADVRAEAIDTGNLAILLHDTGSLDAADAHFRRALRLHRKAKDRRDEAITLGNLARLRRSQGRTDEARRTYERARASHLELGDRRAALGVSLNLAALWFEDGDIDRAETFYREAVEACCELRVKQLEGIARLCLGTCMKERSSGTEALAMLQRAIDILEPLQDPNVALALRTSAQLHIENARFAEASALLRRAESLARAVADPVGVALGLLSRASLLRVQGMADRACADLAREAIAMLEASGSAADLPEALCELGHVVLAGGGDAGTVLESARRAIEAVDAGASSRASRSLACLERAIALQRSGRRVACGACPEDLSAPQLAWLRAHRPDVLSP